MEGDSTATVRPLAAITSRSNLNSNVFEHSPICHKILTFKTETPKATKNEYTNLINISSGSATRFQGLGQNVFSSAPRDPKDATFGGLVSVTSPMGPVRIEERPPALAWLLLPELQRGEDELKTVETVVRHILSPLYSR